MNTQSKQPTIRVCRGPTCEAFQAKEIQNTLANNALYRVESSGCMDNCAHKANIKVGETLVANITPENSAEKTQEGLKKQHYKKTQKEHTAIDDILFSSPL